MKKAKTVGKVREIGVRSRAHAVLFDNNLPFRGRSTERRDTYRRQDKHRNQSAW